MRFDERFENRGGLIFVVVLGLAAVAGVTYLLPIGETIKHGIWAGCVITLVLGGMSAALAGAWSVISGIRQGTKDALTAHRARKEVPTRAYAEMTPKQRARYEELVAQATNEKGMTPEARKQYFAERYGVKSDPKT